MFAQSPLRFFKRIIRAATGGCRRTHYFFDADFGSEPVVSRHIVTDVALGTAIVEENLSPNKRRELADEITAHLKRLT